MAEQKKKVVVIKKKSSKKDVGTLSQGIDVSPKPNDVKKIVTPRAKRLKAKAEAENKEAIEKTKKETVQMLTKKARELKKQEEELLKEIERKRKEQLRKEKNEQYRKEREKKAAIREAKRIENEARRKANKKEYDKAREKRRIIESERELINSKGNRKHQRLSEDLKERREWEREDAREDNRKLTGGYIDAEGFVRGGYALKSMEDYKKNIKAMEAFLKEIENWADSFVSLNRKGLIRQFSEEERKFNESKGKEIYSRYEVGKEEKELGKEFESFFFEKLFRNSLGLSRTGATPKIVMKMIDDETQMEHASYQVLQTISLAKIYSNMTLMYAFMAATYFQLLVSNTPIDEPYVRKRLGRPNVTEIKRAWRQNMTEEQKKKIEDLKQKALEERNVTYEKYEPDDDSARGDWVLHFKQKSFKAFTTVNGEGVFSEEDFKKKCDSDAIWKIARHIYRETKGGPASVSFNCTNENRHVQYLEYGGYKGHSDAVIGMGKYKFKHGVDKDFVYQAPNGFVRLVNATWNAYAMEFLEDVTKEFEEKDIKIDVSKIDKKKAERLLKKGGMPTMEEMQTAFVLSVENGEFDF